jgi:hypothetical protein
MSDSGIFAKKPFYKQTRFLRGVVIFGLVAFFIFAFREEIILIWNQFRGPIWPIPRDVVRAALVIFWNLVIFVATYALSLVLISQFILPVQTNNERRKVFDRFTKFISGQHGPAIFVKNGKKIAKIEELASSKPGVAFIDLCSAIAFQKQWATSSVHQPSVVQPSSTGDATYYTLQSNILTKAGSHAVRIAGPGIAFPERGERIRGVVDLRPQIRSRRDVRAYTRKGIEVQCNVSVHFTLGQPPQVLPVAYKKDVSADNVCVVYFNEELRTSSRDGRQYSILIVEKLSDELDPIDKEEIHRYIDARRRGKEHTTIKPRWENQPSTSPFLFDPQRVFAAIYAATHDSEENEYKEWSELPTHIATEIFRKKLNQEVYDHLYRPEDRDKYPLFDLKRNFANAVRNQGVLAYQFIESYDGQPLEEGQEWEKGHLAYFPVQELNSPKVLRTRGIKVIRAGFSELKPVDPGVREQLFDNWRSYWEREADISRLDYDLDAMRIINKARIESQIEMGNMITKILKTQLLSDEVLAMRLLHALEVVAADPTTREFLPGDTISMLRSLWNWVLPDDTEIQPTLDDQGDDHQDESTPELDQG